jgi:hypothetical protein
MSGVVLVPCWRCGTLPTHSPAGYGVSEAVSCPCGIDFDGSPEEWNRRDPAVLADLPEVKALIEAERERCAKVADTLHYPDETKISASIRDAIRKGATP